MSYCEGLEKLDWSDEDWEAYEKEQEAINALPWAKLGEALKAAAKKQERKNQ